MLIFGSSTISLFFNGLIKLDVSIHIQVCDFGLSRMKHNTFLSSRSTAGTVSLLPLVSFIFLFSKSRLHHVIVDTNALASLAS